MSKSIPHYIKPWLLFRQNEAVSGTVNLSEMPNLCASQNRQEGEVLASLSIEKRHDGRPVIRGEASVDLEITCQRCLKPFSKKFSTKFELVLIKDERQLERISDEDDAVIVEEQLEIAPLIEQELILALPMISKHDDCLPEYKNTPSEEVEVQQPFANLKDLLN